MNAPIIPDTGRTSEEHPMLAPDFADLSGDTIAVHVLRAGTGEDELQFRLCSARPVPLRRVLPALQSMDLEVLNEDTSELTRSDGTPCYVYDFALQAGEDAAQAIAHDGPSTEQRIRDTFHAVWSGLADADGFNALVLAAGLTWQQACVLRSYGRYLRQSLLPYGQSRIQRVLLDCPQTVRVVIELFEARFGDPDRPVGHPDRTAAIAAAQAALDDHIDRIVTVDADRILRAYRDLVHATVRTNAYAPEAFSAARPYLSHKFSARALGELPEPRPLSEIFVYSPTVEGVHLRFGLIARGGLRWSDRLEDYRTEVLGLVKAQEVKNAVIVPAGAKGAFIVKRPPTPTDQTRTHPQHGQDHGLASYRQFICGLLDVVDNQTAPDETPRPHPGVVCHDQSDPYLVVAADKGTATFSDAANDEASRRNYWLGDAFASGGSAGYDHKAMGITARGAWISARNHLRERGIDVDDDYFTVVGIGDMGGDVFGNGMLAHPGITLIAAFDHRHVFVDPTPDVGAARAERRRLFELKGSTWDDYDRGLLSVGGGIWPRTAKKIPVSPQMREALNIANPADELGPTELIRHILCAPVDLLWNGGVGTYVRSSDESHGDLGDKVNDAVRITALQVRAAVIVEGGNLGVSPRGRIEFARQGGLVNTDAIDNAAGVDCSDHEVNIKILLDSAQGRQLDRAARNDLLAQMTDEVAALVLDNNTAQNHLLSDARFNTSHMVGTHARMTSSLERRRGLNRDREHLPTSEEYDQLAKAGRGLSTPELATLMAHVKLDLKAELLVDDHFRDAPFVAALENYFPTALRHRFGDAISQHPLRREIIVTSLVNHVVATGGITYAFRLSDETGACTGDVIRAHTIASRIFEMDTLWQDIHRAGLAPAMTNTLILEGRRLLDRTSRWLLLNRPQPLDVESETRRFVGPVAALRPYLAAMLHGDENTAATRAHVALLDQNVDPAVARRISESLYAFSLLDIVEVADDDPQSRTQLARTYFQLSDHLGIDELLRAVSALPRGQRWLALARLALREDLYRTLRTLTLDVTDNASEPYSPPHALQEWERDNHTRLARARRTLADISSSESRDLAALSVASTQIRRMVSHA